jgi:hypothetical protein
MHLARPQHMLRVECAEHRVQAHQLLDKGVLMSGCLV